MQTTIRGHLSVSQCIRLPCSMTKLRISSIAIIINADFPGHASRPGQYQHRQVNHQGAPQPSPSPLDTHPPARHERLPRQGTSRGQANYMNPRAAMQSSSAIQCEISSGRVVYTRDSGRVSCTNHTPRRLRFPRVACECMETHTSTRLQIGLRQRVGRDEGVFFFLFYFFLPSSLDCFAELSFE